MADGSLNFDTKIDESGFKKGLSGLGGAAKAGLGVATKALGAAASGLTALGAASLNVGKSFEAGMSEVQAISGATGKDLEDLTAKAKEMGAKTKFSATESAEAMTYMAMAGWKTQDMINGIEGIMDLAAASGEDLAATSDIVTDALTAFGLSAADSGHFADVLAAASSNANTNVAMMGDTFKYAAPLAGAMGFSVEDTATAIGLMANAGIKGSQAGTSLRSMFTKLAKPTDTVQNAMDALNFSLTDSEGNVKSLSVIMMELRDKFADLGQAEQVEMAANLAGQEAMSGLLAIVNASDADFKKLSTATALASTDINALTDALQNCGVNWDKYSTKTWNAEEDLQGLLENIVWNLTEAGATVDELQEYLQCEFDFSAEDALAAIQAVQTSLDGTTGSAKRMAETMIDNLDGAVTILQSGLEGLGVSVYECAQESLKDVVKEAQGMVQQLQDAFNDGGLDGMISAVGGVLAQIVQRMAEEAPNLISMATELITSFCEGLRDAPGIGEAGATLIGSLAKGIITCSAELNSTCIVLIAELATGLGEQLPTLIPAIVELIMGFGQTLIENAALLIPAALQLIQGLAEGIIAALPVLVAALPQIIDTIVTTLIESIPLMIETSITLLSALVEALPEVIQALVEALPEIITSIIDTLLENLPLLLDAAITLFMALVDAIPEIVVTLVESLPQITTAILDGLAEAIPKVFTAAKDLLWQIIEAIPEIVTGLATVVPDIITGIVDGLLGGLGDVKDAALELGGSILGGIKSFFGINSPSTVMTEQGDYLVQGLINGISEMPGKMAQTLSDTLAKVTQWGQQMLSMTKTTITEMVSNMVSLLSELPGKVWTWLVNVVSRVTAWQQQMVNTAKTAINNMISGIIGLLTQLPGKVQAELAKVTAGMVSWGVEIVSKMKEVGSNIVTGIWNGISSGWDWLRNKVGNLAHSLLDAAKGALGIESPSKAFRDEVGRWLMPGTVEGVKKTLPAAIKDMKGAVSKLISSMQSSVNAQMGAFRLNASSAADRLALAGGGSVTNIDQSMHQDNTYNVPVATPSEVNKSQREAFRKFAGGVK